MVWPCWSWCCCRRQVPNFNHAPTVTKVLENTAESVGSIPRRVSPMLSAALAGNLIWLAMGHGAVTIVRRGV